MNIQLKPIIAALGLGLATLSVPASAVTLYSPITNFEDDDVEFVIDQGVIGTLDAGDTLVAMVEIAQTTDPMTAASASVLPNELTGVTAITLVGFADLDGVGGLNDMLFSPYAGGLNTFLGGDTVTGGGAGGGAMIALYLGDTSPDLVTTGSTSCASLVDCITQATDGTLYAVAGFEGDTDEFWIALNAVTDISDALASNANTALGQVNFGLSILDAAGNPFGKDALTCTGATADFCLGDDQIDVIGSGQVLGGQFLGAGIVADGAFVHSDFDFQVAVVPEPATLGLLGLGLLGMGASLRRRVR